MSLAPAAPMNTAPTETQAITTRPPGAGVIIRTPDLFTQKVAEWSAKGFHVLSPMANFSALPANYGLVPTLVSLDPSPTSGAGDVYENRLFTKEGEVAIGKLGLAKIAQAAGMTIKTERTDNRLIPHLWEVRATVRFIGLDGTPQELDATEEYDMRDGSARLKGFTANQIQAFRSKGLRHCEARAINAAIRQFGIKQKYTRQELQKPFVIVRIVFTPDMSDPATRQQVTDRAMAGSTSLYPALLAHASTPAPEPLDVIGVGGRTPEEIDARPLAPSGRVVEDVRFDIEAGVYDVRLNGGEVVTTSSQEIGRLLDRAKKDGRRVWLTTDEAGGVKTCELAPADPARAEAPVGQTTIEKIETRDGKSKDSGRPWRLYRVTLSNGDVVATFSETLQQVIDAAVAQKAAVKYTADDAEGDRDRKLVTIEMVDTRQQGLPMGDGGKY